VIGGGSNEVNTLDGCNAAGLAVGKSTIKVGGKNTVFLNKTI
jgi:hypothetical protein